MLPHLPVAQNLDVKGYFRCCISCKQPWQCEPKTIKEMSTYIAYSMDALCIKSSDRTATSVQYFFGKPVEISHVIKKAHVSGSMNAMCDPGHNFTTAGNHTIRIDKQYWQQVNRNNFYIGRWPKPDLGDPLQIVQHQKLKDFLRGHNTDTICLPETLLACQNCNRLMDSDAKMRKMLFGDLAGIQGIVPMNLVEYSDNNGPFTTMNANTTFQTAQLYMGVLVGWYIHSSFVYLQNGVSLQRFNRSRKLTAVLSFLALSISCSWFDLIARERNQQNPDFAFKGVLSLYISLYQYVCMCTDYPAINMSFPQFHNFLLLELPECPIDRLWDRNTYPYLYSYLTHNFNPHIIHPKELVQNMSDALMDMYTHKTRYMIRAVFVSLDSIAPPISDIDRAFYKALQLYFPTAVEIIQVYNQIPAPTDTPTHLDLQQYVDAVGIAAILWPFRRFLDQSCARGIVQAMDEWMNYYISNFEWKNIAMNKAVNGETLSLNEAALVYKFQYSLRLDDLLQENKTMLQFVQNYDHDDLRHTMETEPRCSLLKATARLLQYRFTDNSWRNEYLIPVGPGPGPYHRSRRRGR